MDINEFNDKIWIYYIKDLIFEFKCKLPIAVEIDFFEEHN